MCDVCGCDRGGHEEHAHMHAHGVPHSHPHRVDVGTRILSRNDRQAEENRQWLAARGVVAINLISAPGSGKTYLLERTLERLNGRVSCSVITGDQRTDQDAKRLQGKGAPVVQIETENACHLDASHVARVLPEVVTAQTRLLFIENVGNLVCPAAFDLGENFKVGLLSITEGEDKPIKYPSLFSQAPVTVLTKLDLLPHLDFNLAQCRDYLRRVRPGVFLFELSAKTGEGMDAWLQYLSGLSGPIRP